MGISDMRFLDAFKEVVGLEGGYCDIPADRGGATKYGISQASYPDLNIAALTLEQAKAIYYTDFWAALSLDKIESAYIAGEIFECAVNCGRSAAVRIAQRSLAFLGETIKQDGIMGPSTIEKLNKWGKKDPISLFKALNGYQFARYALIVEQHPDQLAFARGWLKRIQAYRS